MLVQAKRRQLRAWVVGRFARGADQLIRKRTQRSLRDPASVHRVLVIKPCCLGDVLMATPALRALRHHYPDAEIDVLTTRWSEAALRGNHRISRVIHYPDRPKMREIMRLAGRLRRTGYDIGIGLDRSPVVNTLLALSGIPERAGIDNKGRGVGLTHRVVPALRQHETELYLAVVATLGVLTQGIEPEFWPNEEASQRARELLPSADGPIIVIHPGGAVNPEAVMISKRWPAPLFGELASLLTQRLGATVVLVGSDSDRHAVETTKDFADVPPLDLCGTLSIPELAAICANADLFIGNDSGVSHLASAVGTPTVTIFGPTSPAHYRPLGPNAAVCSLEASMELAYDVDLRGGVSFERRLDIGRIPVQQVLYVCLQLLQQESKEWQR